MDRTEARLDNIRAVEPVLSALRTVSQGSMQAARKRGAAVERYGRELLALTTWLPEGVKPSPSEALFAHSRTLLVALGSDRGLCGRFNNDIVNQLVVQHRILDEQGIPHETWSLGLRLKRTLENSDVDTAFSGRFARRTLPAFDTAHDLASRMLAGLHAGDFREIVLVLNRERRAGRYSTVAERLLPAESATGSGSVHEVTWPSPIIETDPTGLLDRILAQAAAVQLFGAMLASSAAEHAARYHLLEDAAQNTERLAGDLEMAVQLARQQAITAEMQELAAGSGLIKS